MQTINKFAIAKDGGCKIHTNKAYTILGWNIKQQLTMVLGQCKHLEMNI
jgi:hypothetical protein